MLKTLQIKPCNAKPSEPKLANLFSRFSKKFQKVVFFSVLHFRLRPRLTDGA